MHFSKNKPIYTISRVLGNLFMYFMQLHLQHYLCIIYYKPAVEEDKIRKLYNMNNIYIYFTKGITILYYRVYK